MTLKYELLPEHLRAGTQRYVEHGVLPGDFLKAVIRNDLRGALFRADKTSRANLHEIVRFFHFEVPSDCHGDKEKMLAWNARGGLTGRSA